ncbi:MAG: bifunctional 2-polyprenyl-6-hydroxyphenol methylase/3-demethylubiquinol 3-O-methyltransferase UbiG [Magnetococcales bacterium]|nr:bifunctional 2-polyprenyl-6-hydroxyphenol methylase/3-demethylubiquinol 3-O-methyltransferase UbiG [Magnetococcales bacterium]
MSTADPSEIEKFEKLAHEWWDPSGKFRPLHDINPIRVDYIVDQISKHYPDKEPTDIRVLDIGCGGGILCEALAMQGYQITAIDRSDEIVNVARAHQKQSGSSVEYLTTSSEALLKDRAGHYDVVVSMEVLEHVSNPPLFLEECGGLIKPDGLFFFATLNRTIKSFLFAIVGAEYILNWLPRGTHEYAKFIRPSEVTQWLREQNIRVRDVSGITFNPRSIEWHLSRDASVNYMGFAHKIVVDK